ncbi:MAG: hypothetical protein HRT56_00145 [Coraliomargarita sp.]|nr:hypothetical protein [Coraliomargarita sp.]
MKPINKEWNRPKSAAEVATASSDAESFGRNLRDWQHELQHLSSRKAFAQQIAKPPSLLRNRLNDDGQCDAYLAAYVEWLCERHGVDTPAWLAEEERSADKAWFDYPPLWQDSFIHAPAAFRRRGVFTRPDDVLKLRAGRPKVSHGQKRQKRAERQRRYRERIREKLKRLAELEQSR